MPFENTAGLGVNNQYGARNTGGTVGVQTTRDSTQQLCVDFTAQSLIEGFIPPLVLPRGAHFLRYILRVDEAFTLTGTTPTLLVGGTVPGTNGVTVTAAELAAVGTKIPASTGQGTWSVTSATGTTASEKVRVILGGTTPAVTPGAGKASLVAEYIYETKV